MKFILSSLLLAFLMSVNGYSQENELRAFPGAEGFGRDATGGRGGRVIYVTNLEDNSSPGSLRYAVNQSYARIIIFKVSGTIKLKSRLSISKGNVTIAGQTAPGDGITLRDYNVSVSADNVIVRFLRFRMGDEANQEDDAMGGRRHKNIIIDHCSMSWSTDECASFYDNENFTLQWCILSESLRISIHGKGRHGYGGIWGGRGVTFHHNLLAHHDSRNPRFCGSRYSNLPAEELIDHRNNVIYNWGGNSCYAAEGGRYNMVNNYYKAGPATSNKSRIIQPYPDNGGNNQPKGTYGFYYITGNHITASSSVTNNNDLGVNMSSSFSSDAPGVTLDDILSDVEFPFVAVTTHSAEAAYEKVLEHGGASLFRDAVDVRIMQDLSTGTATYMTGGNGSKNGLIDTQNAVGGWPVLNSTVAPEDSDNDGMPDVWETANGLSISDAADAKLKTVDGIYTNVEVYINSLVETIVANQNDQGVLLKTIENSIDKNEINIFFNNSSKQLIVNHKENVDRVQVYSMTGRLISTQTFHSGMIAMDIPGLKKGNYIVRVVNAKKKVFSKIIAIH